LVFGESIPDTVAPTVSIVSPEDGATIEGDVDLVIEFADDQQPVVISATITITSDALPEQPEPATGAYAGPSMLNFPITGLPAGEYTITVEGVDESDNPASDEITITIDDPASADESGDDASSADDDATDDAPADDDDSDDDAADDGDAGDDDDSSGSATADQNDEAADRGCACSVEGSPDAWAAFGLFVLALGGARRRRASLPR
jgi:MYXO-CTERM domain-containing protein